MERAVAASEEQRSDASRLARSERAAAVAALLACACALASASAVAQTDAPVLSTQRVRARWDMVLSWMPRYRLDATAGPLGLEQQVWQRVESLPFYHRVALDATGLADGLVSVHFAGWGAIDMLFDAVDPVGTGVGAGDVAIGYVELNLQPVRLWAGRRFITFGPPGGLHVDGGGVSARASFGLLAEAFVGRPVTPVRTRLLGPEPSFDGAAAAYGARVAYTDAGALGVSASYAELWSHGIVGSRTADFSAYWYPGDVRFEAGTKIDVRDPGVAQARVGASYRAAPELSIDADYTHVEPRRWIPPWSILSVFDTSTFDEVMAAVTVRPVRSLALRAELAGRMFSATDVQVDEPQFGYRADLIARVLPSDEPGPRLRVMVSRRDDGYTGYTLLQAGAAFDPLPDVVMALDGAFAIDDDGARDSLFARASVDWDPVREWKLGLTVSVSRTPIVESETRAMLRVRWSPEVQ